MAWRWGGHAPDIYPWTGAATPCARWIMGERGREMGENDNDGVCEVASQRKKIRERDDTWVTSCLFDAPHLVVGCYGRRVMRPIERTRNRRLRRAIPMGIRSFSKHKSIPEQIVYPFQPPPTFRTVQIVSCSFHAC
jgi:hypothetical protein